MTNPLLYAGMAAAGYLAARGRAGQRAKSDEFKYVKVTTKCVRCGGSGRYGHYGACFRCGGIGTDPSIRVRQIVFASNVTEARQKAIRQEETDRLSLQREKARTRRERKRAEKVEAGIAKVEAEYPGIGAALQTDHDIVQDINNRVQNYGKISSAQAALVFKLAKEVRKKGTVKERRAQERAAAADAPTGRETMQGRILKVTERVEGPGYHARTVVKLLVKSHSGYLAWGSAPRGIGEATTGDEIEFTATFTPSDDDPKFAFYKRPTKAVLLKKGQGAQGGRRGLGKTRPRSPQAAARGLRKGMTVELLDGSIVEDIERFAPRDTRFSGVLVKAEKWHTGKAPGASVTFSQSNVVKSWKRGQRARGKTVPAGEVWAWKNEQRRSESMAGISRGRATLYIMIPDFSLTSWRMPAGDPDSLPLSEVYGEGTTFGPGKWVWVSGAEDVAHDSTRLFVGVGNPRHRWNVQTLDFYVPRDTPLRVRLKRER